MNSNDIISKMTLEEKVAYLSGADFWHLKQIERFDVPAPMMCDGPHGLRKQNDETGSGVHDSVVSVCFPTSSALAASFDRDLVARVGKLLGEECASMDIKMLLAPGVNIKRSPLCGRNFEYFSEDPYLAGELAAAYINALQSTGTGACLKHFAVNNQETRRFNISANLDERTLREVYLAPFENAVKGAQPESVMCSYNKINGVYGSENKYLLTDILRNEWGFKGFTMTDWGANQDRVAGVIAGLDLEMPGSGRINTDKLIQTVKSGELDEKSVDTACERILNWALSKKNTKQLPYDLETHHQNAREIAAGCMVLLKNEDNILPLTTDKKVVFIGEGAISPQFQGGGSSHVNAFRVESAFNESKAYSDNCDYFVGIGNKKDLKAAVENAKNADVAVVFVSLPQESESADRTHLRLPSEQDALVFEIAKVQPNTVVVLQNGAPVNMPWVGDVKGILETHLTGEGSGGAVADILFGKVNPSGKLAETFPLDDKNLPGLGDLHNCDYTESVFVGYQKYNTENIEVLYPFGYGLSYTEFEYRDLFYSEREGKISVEFKIKNVGTHSGAEVAQIYIAPPKESKILRTAMKLKGFEKVFLNKSEEKLVKLELDSSSFAFWGADGWTVEKGDYTILVGSSSRDIRLETKICTDGVETPVIAPHKINATPQTLPYTFSTTLEQAAKTSRWGRRIYRFLGSLSWIKNNPMARAGVLETPINNMMQISGGKLGLDFGNALLNVYNNIRPKRNLLKVIKLLIKQSRDMKKML